MKYSTTLMLAMVVSLASTTPHVARATDGRFRWTPAFHWTPEGRQELPGPCHPYTLDQPDSVAVDRAGDVYFTDEAGPDAIQELTTSGNLRTVLNRGKPPAASAHYFGLSLAWDPRGGLYVAARERGTVERLTPNGTLVIVAGRPGDRAYVNGPASKARLEAPSAITIGPRGTVYVVDSRTIRKISADGSISTLAGDRHARIPRRANGAPYAVNGTGSHAIFMTPTAIAVDAQGVVYVADSFAGTVEGKATFMGIVQTISPRGQVSTLAGTTDAVGENVDGPRSSSLIQYIHGIALGRDGALYLATDPTPAIRKVDPSGFVSTLQKGTSNFLTDMLIDPSAIAIGPQGEIFVTDDPNIRGEITYLKLKHYRAYWLHRIVGQELDTLCKLTPKQ